MEGQKVCTKCNLRKSLTEFYKDKYQKSGYRYYCKKCHDITTEERIKKYSRLETKDKKVCIKCNLGKSLTEFYKDKCRKSGHQSLCKLCQHKYSNSYINTRRRNDPEFKLLGNLRVRLYDALKGKSKSQTTRQLIGIDFETFSKWIEYQLEEGMTMKNYGSAWHLDHVLPISSFNLLDEEELQKAMNWINIRPLLALKNIKKSNKIDPWLYLMQEVKAHYFLKHLDEL